MNEMVGLIQTLGFPVVCVLALGYYVYSTNKQMQASNEKREESQRIENKQREDRLYQIIDEQGATLQANTQQTAELKTAIEQLNNTLVKRGLDIIEN